MTLISPLFTCSCLLLLLPVYPPVRVIDIKLVTRSERGVIYGSDVCECVCACSSLTQRQNGIDMYIDYFITHSLTHYAMYVPG